MVISGEISPRPPGVQDVREATPPGRRAYIAAQKAINCCVASRGGFYEALPKIREAFAELNRAMLDRALDPPIDPEGDLGGLISGFSKFYSTRSTSEGTPGGPVLDASVDTLYLVVDHGGGQRIAGLVGTPEGGNLG